MPQAGILDQLTAIYRSAVDGALRTIPHVLAGVITLLTLVVVAKILERLLRGLLVRLRFDVLLQHAGIDKALHRLGLRESINVVLPRLVYFLLLCLIARIGADLLGLRPVSDAFAAFFGYLPNVVAAVLLLVVGSAASQFAGQTVAQAAREANIDFARSLGNLVSMLILFVVGIMALSQLRIETEIIHVVTICSLSGVALAFGLSIGLGARAITRDIVAGFYVRKVVSPGDEIEVDGERGTLVAITSAQALLATSTRTVAIANSRLLRGVARWEPPAPPGA